MEREIIIPRKKSISFWTGFLMLICSPLMAFPALLYFNLIPFADGAPPLALVILGVAICPLLLGCSFFYFAQLFIPAPILIVNQYGIHDQFKPKTSVGMIYWRDIENIRVIPLQKGNVMFCIILKCPEKYIKNKRLLARYQKKKRPPAYGHLSFQSLYFPKQIEEVVTLMQYYYKKSREEATEFGDF